MKFWHYIKENCLIISLVLIFLILFLFRLDYNTITSWDEGWYGSIARQIVRSNNWMFLNWNGNPYYDHPPLGFWLMAATYKLLGVNEITTRLPSIFAGIIALIFIYKLGYLISKNKYVGLVSGLILSTSAWYFIRVRSGNLDALLAMLIILVLYAAFKSQNKIIYLPLTGLFFGLLLLTKTLVGFALVVPIVLLNISHLKKRDNAVWVIFCILAFAVVTVPWYYLNYQKYPDFIAHHFINIGTRNESILSFLNIKPEKPLFYLHMGVRKWYYLWLAGFGYLLIRLIISLFLRLKKIKIEISLNIQYPAILLITNLVILYPFLSNPKTEIWHLIPVYIPMALIIAYGFYDLISIIVLYIKQFTGKNLQAHIITTAIYLCFFIFIAFIQLKILLPEVYPEKKQLPDDVAISKQAGKYKTTIILDDDFLPLAVFYAERNIRPLGSLDLPEKTLVGLFKSNKKNFVVITRNWAINNLNSSKLKYEVFEKNSSFSIISR